MVLKKQTVWLLTMLSLIIVLSVFYISSPNQPADFAFEENENVNGDNVGENNEEGTITSEMARDDVFVALQMKREEKRSIMEQDYMAVIASKDVTAEAKSEAYTKLQALNELAAKETMLETLIVAQGYEDAIVTTNGNKVNVIVKANAHTKKDAAKIMLLGKEQLGYEFVVAVEFLPNTNN
jgi:stage III sporulation protein AH